MALLSSCFRQDERSWCAASLGLRWGFFRRPAFDLAGCLGGSYKITESEGDGTQKIRIGDGSIEALIERVVEVDLELVHEERYAKYVAGRIQY
eukprot:m.552005 g.552005  ORF g.552005 m.552005 type:complete len:93 (+) comp57737_c2_seq7:350-628(+)